MFVDPTDCNAFFYCENGKETRYKCGPGLNFNPIKMECNKEEEVNCHATTIASTTDGTTVCAFKVISCHEDKGTNDFFLSGNK